jgi:hypothetical protein
MRTWILAGLNHLSQDFPKLTSKGILRMLNLGLVFTCLNRAYPLEFYFSVLRRGETDGLE